MTETTKTTETIPTTELLASRPTWAKAAIVAEYETDQSDSMTDYFATRTERHVFLGWSKHSKDLFAEMRKAAATFTETAHLGPGKDVHTAVVVTAEDVISGGTAYWKGTPSPWHTELHTDPAATYFTRGRQFETLAEAEAFIADKTPEPIMFDGTVRHFEWRITSQSVEHREKYSMGAGYYLKGTGRYSSGWTVSKTHLGDSMFRDDTIERVAVVPTSSSADLATSLAACTGATHVTVNDGATTGTSTGVTVTLNAEKNGVEIRFPAKPTDAVRERLKANGWRWSRFSECWYHRDSPETRAFAQEVGR